MAALAAAMATTTVTERSIRGTDDSSSDSGVVGRGGGGDTTTTRMPDSELKPRFADHLLRVHGAPPDAVARVAFALGRAANVFLCYALATSMGRHTPPSAVHQLQLVLIAVGVVRHWQWVWTTASHPLPWRSNVQVVLSNLLFDVTCTIMGFGAPAGPGAWQVLAVAMFVCGVVVETYSEHQRAVWKANPRNDNRLYTAGLFAYAQHINYTGYCTWRIGLALCSGSYVALAMMAVVCVVMTHHSLPNLRQYLYSRYGSVAMAEWTRVTPHKMIPGVW